MIRIRLAAAGSEMSVIRSLARSGLIWLEMNWISVLEPEVAEAMRHVGNVPADGNSDYP
jgi:hypothetical protein